MPKALGCSLCLPEGIVCRRCNNALSSVEQPVLRDLAMLRGMWVNPKFDHRSSFSIPGKVIEGEGLTGRRVNLRRDLSLAPPEPVCTSETLLDDGRLQFVWRATSQASANRLRDRLTQKHPQGKWEFFERSKHEIVVEVDIGVGAVISLNGHRLATKCALNYLAYRLGPEVCVSRDFDDARDFILNGTEFEPSICDIVDNPETERAVNTPSPLHSITLIADPSDLTIQSLVVVFGLFFYLVTLAPRRRCAFGWWYTHEFWPWDGTHHDRELRKRIAGVPRLSQRRSRNSDELLQRARAATVRNMPEFWRAIDSVDRNAVSSNPVTDA